MLTKFIYHTSKLSIPQKNIIAYYEFFPKTLLQEVESITRKSE